EAKTFPGTKSFRLKSFATPVIVSATSRPWSPPLTPSFWTAPSSLSNKSSSAWSNTFFKRKAIENCKLQTAKLAASWISKPSTALCPICNLRFAICYLKCFLLVSPLPILHPSGRYPFLPLVRGLLLGLRCRHDSRVQPAHRRHAPC